MAELCDTKNTYDAYLGIESHCSGTNKEISIFWTHSFDLQRR